MGFLPTKPTLVIDFTHKPLIYSDVQVLEILLQMIVDKSEKWKIKHTNDVNNFWCEYINILS